MSFPDASDDITSLDEFPLRWRFTEARYALLPPEVLPRLKPLTRDAAVRVAAEAVQRCQHGDERPITFRSDEAPGGVRTQLLDLPIEPAAEVLLSWNTTTALLTDWAIFVSHWDDFCYPASDDVTVWPRDGRWTLCYRHYEVFQFWPPNTPSASPPTIAERHTP